MPSYKAGAGFFFFQGTHKVQAASKHRVKEQDCIILKVNTEVPSELAAFPLVWSLHTGGSINSAKIQNFFACTPLALGEYTHKINEAIVVWHSFFPVEGVTVKSITSSKEGRKKRKKRIEVCAFAQYYS